MPFLKRSCCQSLAYLLAVALLHGVALAGGGPENLFLVVNANSAGSKTIANHYIRLRDIPASNVFYVDWRRGVDSIGVEIFRNELLKPVLKEIDKRKLSIQIDYIVYSSDLPWRIELKSDFPKLKLEKWQHPFASLSGATYLWQYVTHKSPTILNPKTNWYVLSGGGQNIVQCKQLGTVPSRGFRGRYLWDPAGQKSKDPKTAQRYFLSAMLGVTVKRGNTVDEVISYLRRAKLADVSPPEGTFYFVRHGGPRSTARHDCFASVAGQLKALGAKAEVRTGMKLTGADDALGIVFGTQKYDFSKDRVQLMPGAICDNLTSYGGVLDRSLGQTSLSESLRHGAAGASGTAFEPTNLQAKFPLPSLMLHYRRGCSLAEAFYQSVASPYQLLVVGDPLCQPWAARPKVKVEGTESGQTVAGVFSLTPVVTPATGQRAGPCELFVDGRLRARVAPGKTLNLDTTKLSEGNHDFCLVAHTGNAIESQGRWAASLMVDNTDQADLSITAPPSPSASENLTVKATAPGAENIAIRQNWRVLGRIRGEKGKLSIPAGKLGRGPVRLQAIDEASGRASSPVWINIR